MTVSVIVPVYQADEWIGQCLASIEAQTYKDIELIRIDDPKGTGAAAARNRGLLKAKGDWIAFCDADDYLEPDAIQNMVDASEGVDMVVGSFRKLGDFEQVIRYPKTTELVMELVAEYVMWNLQTPRHHQILSGCWAKLYRADLVRAFPFLTTAEDMSFTFDYLTRCKSVRFLSDVVYNNRKHQGSLSTTFNEHDKPGLFGFLRALREVKRFLLPFFSEAEIDAAIDNSKVYHSMLYFSRICQQTGWPMRDALMRLYP